MASGIYKIFCTASQRVYVGSSVNITKRWNEHKRHLKAGSHHNAALQNAWIVYGEEAFTFAVLEHTPVEHLIERENHWMRGLNTCERQHGYNAAPAAGSQLGFKHSDSTRRRMSATRKGRFHDASHLLPYVQASRGVPLSAEVKRKLSDGAKARLADPEKSRVYREAQANKTLTEEGRRRMSEANIGKRWTEQQRAKFMAAAVGRRHSPEAIQKMRDAAAQRKKDATGRFAPAG